MLSRNLYSRKEFKNQAHGICSLVPGLLICSEISKPVKLSKDPIFLSPPEVELDLVINRKGAI